MQTLHLIVGGTVNQDELIAMMFDRYPDLNSTDVMTRTLTMSKMFTEWFFGSPSNWEAVRHVRSVYSTFTEPCIVLLWLVPLGTGAYRFDQELSRFAVEFIGLFGICSSLP